MDEENNIEEKEKQDAIDNKLEERRIAIDEENTKIDKVDCLRRLLDTVMIDEDKTQFSDPVLKNGFDASEVKTIKNKIFNLIKEF